VDGEIEVVVGGVREERGTDPLGRRWKLERTVRTAQSVHERQRLANERLVVGVDVDDAVPTDLETRTRKLLLDRVDVLWTVSRCDVLVAQFDR